MLNKTKIWHSGLSKIAKVLLWSALAVFAGTAINAVASPSEPTQAKRPQPIQTKQPAAVKAKPRPPIQEKKPIKQKKIITETAAIAFSKTTAKDDNLEKGKTVLKTAGVNGIKTLTYEVTSLDGKQSDKKLIKEEVTTQPVAEVVAVGTYVSPCDPNYSGCVPKASDVDCASGSGNGPAYVSGPVYVTGRDIYDLDRDGDGVGCD